MSAEEHDELIASLVIEIPDVLNACRAREFMATAATILKQNFFARGTGEDTVESMNKWVMKVNELLDEEERHCVSLGLSAPAVSRLKRIEP